MRMIVICASAVILLAGASIWLWPKPDEPDPSFLATDAFFQIGGESITLPFVAVRSPRSLDSFADSLDEFRREGRHFSEAYKRRFRQVATDPANPMKLASVDVLVFPYKYYGQHVRSTAICALLQRAWAQQVCVGSRPGLLKYLPEKFNLIGVESIANLSHWHVSGGGNVLDRVDQMNLRMNIPEAVCGDQPTLCTAALLATPTLLAVWSVWSSSQPSGSALAMAKSQGAAISQFIRHGLGADENYDLLVGN